MNKFPQVPCKAVLPDAEPTRPLPVEMLLNESGQLRLAFKGQIYTLRQTRNDKLILTK